MIEYYFQKIGVTVTLPADGPDRSAIWEATGEPIFAEIIRRELLDQYGVYGHQITQSTTPLDLAAAMQSETMQRYKPVLKRGQELLTPSDLPDGVFS